MSVDGQGQSDGLVIVETNTGGAAMSSVANYDELADVDSSPNAESWLAMLRGMWSGQQREKDARYADLFGRLRLEPGERVLEVGCGAGGASRLLARLTHSQNPIVAVDPSRLAIAEAERLSTAAGNAEPSDSLSTALGVVAYQVMDGRALSFADESFGAVFCARMLVHAPEPERIFAEMVRVLRPGGRLLAIEPDRDGLMTSVKSDVVHRLYWATRRSLNPRIGRDLYPMFRRAGLLDVEVIPDARLSIVPPGADLIAEVRRDLARQSGDYWELVNGGLIERGTLERYAEELEEAARSGIYLRSDLEFAVFGRKAAGAVGAA